MTTEEQRLKRNEYMRAWRRANPDKEKARQIKHYAVPENRERRARAAKAWKLVNIESFRAKAAKRAARWRKANPEKAAANDRKRYTNHKEQYARLNKAWRAAHPERVREYAARRTPKPASVTRAIRARRRAAGLCASCIAPATHGSMCLWHREKRNAQARKGGSKYIAALNHTHNYRARKRGAYVEPINRVAVFERDNGICHICAQPVELSDMHLDHVVPLTRGGKHSYENVKASHARCNQSKGNRTTSSHVTAGV